MSTHLIKLEEAGKRYISHRFTLEIAKTDFLVISGANGTGKTTLLLMILGFIYPDSGLISKGKLKIGYVPEKVMLPPFINVFEYLKTMAKIKKDQLNMDLIHRFQIPIDLNIHELSKGNQQKIAIVTALMGHPHMIIFDEPLSGLDEVMQDVFFEVISDYYHQGISMMVSTHEPNRFMDLATKHISL